MPKQGRDGKFLADFAPELVDERYWNRFDVLFYTGMTDSGVNRITLFDTGMAIAEVGQGDAVPGPVGKKWIIKGAVWAPNSLTDIDHFHDLDAVEGIQVTLTMPSVTHDVARNEGGIIGRSLLMTAGEGTPAGDALTSLIHFPLPLDILSPIPVFSEQLAVSIWTANDAVGYRNKAFCLSILYGWADAYISDVLAARQVGL